MIANTSTMQNRGGFNANIHGARGLFAAMVFVFHISNSGLTTFSLIKGSLLVTYALPSLKFGVDLFFGISGFVIVGALARAPSIAAFLRDRATRIYPALWASLIAITAVSLATGRWIPSLTVWMLNFLAPPPFFPMDQVNPAAWSLGYEMTFYALCAACWWLRARGVRSWRVIAAVVGTGLLVMYPRAMLMAAGVGIALGYGRGAAMQRLSARPLLALMGFLLLWRLVELAGGSNPLKLTPIDLPFALYVTLVPGLLAVGALGGLALLGIADGRGVLSRLLRSAPLQWLGGVSYSFYLWHPVVLGAAKAALARTGVFVAAGPAAQILLFVVGLPPTLIVAELSRRWIEVGATRWLRRFGPRGVDAVPRTAAAAAEPVAR